MLTVTLLRTAIQPLLVDRGDNTVFDFVYSLKVILCVKKLLYT